MAQGETGGLEADSASRDDPRLAQVARDLPGWAESLGFSQIGIADVDLKTAEPGLLAWLEAGFHGSMGYMAQHGTKRARPAELVPGTVRVITARMNYLPRDTPAGWQALEWQRLAAPEQAVVSIYARGRDYHKTLRQRLQKLADVLAERLAPISGPLAYRVFTDSAPVLEVELASRSGQGWRGKHTLTLSRDAGSMFFLGEIFVDCPLPPTPAVSGHCGQCQACLTTCPTQAIVAPYQLDARRCISYLTIEHDGPIPEAMRPLLGNRIYGCDDCQLVCPWNKFAQRSPVADFDLRPHGAPATLLQLWAWDEPTFLRLTEGSAIRRIGHLRWQRNLAVAMGNALAAGVAEAASLRAALQQALPGAPPLLAQHIAWALAQQAPSSPAP
jgi:epoxyqueuosine reductase